MNKKTGLTQPSRILALLCVFVVSSSLAPTNSFGSPLNPLQTSQDEAPNGSSGDGDSLVERIRAAEAMRNVSYQQADSANGEQNNSLIPRVARFPIDENGATGLTWSRLLIETLEEDRGWLGTLEAALSSRMFDEDQNVRVEDLRTLSQIYPNVFSLEESSSGQVTAFRVDSGELRRSMRTKSNGFREWLSDKSKRPLFEMVRCDATWEDVALNKQPDRIVVILSGLHSTHSNGFELANKLAKKTDLPAYVFLYPNDAPIEKSGSAFQQNLKELSIKHPGSRCSIVTHSMGALVARSAIEFNPPLELNNVAQLIMVCPPNHGSALAQYAAPLEGMEQILRLFGDSKDKSNDTNMLLAVVLDGLGEATSDLIPHSEFLTRLNQQKRNRDVRYSILAGSKGPLTPTMRLVIGQLWHKVDSQIDDQRELADRVTEIVQCPELCRGRGDGVVCLESSKLDGVDDYRVLPIHHLTWGRLDSDGGEAMVEAICKCLTQP